MQQLTNDQINALSAISDLYIDLHPFLEVSGPAGTGKSTLIRTFLHRTVPGLSNAFKLLREKPRPVILTATTNKAAQALHQATGAQVRTIHAVLGIRLENGKLNYPDPKHNIRKDIVYFIDEFSYIDQELLDYLKRIQGKNCSFVFFGDPCQLTPVNQKTIPVVDENFPRVTLEEIVRQESPALKDISNQLREFVKGGVFPDLIPDDQNFIYYDGPNAEDDFIDEMKAAFKRGTAKFISYTNKRVEEINKFMLEEMLNRRELAAGDMAINNSHVSSYRLKLKVDEVVFIDKVYRKPLHLNIGKEIWNVPGQRVLVRGAELFVPDTYEDFKKIKELDPSKLSNAQTELIKAVADLRTEYACTVHKSQGSTYDEVFIDLSDYKSIQSDKTLSRLLYVALSRTRKKLHVIGEL